MGDPVPGGDIRWKPPLDGAADRLRTQLVGTGLAQEHLGLSVDCVIRLHELGEAVELDDEQWEMLKGKWDELNAGSPDWMTLLRGRQALALLRPDRAGELAINDGMRSRIERTVSGRMQQGEGYIVADEAVAVLESGAPELQHLVDQAQSWEGEHHEMRTELDTIASTSQDLDHYARLARNMRKLGALPDSELRPVLEQALTIARDTKREEEAAAIEAQLAGLAEGE